MRKLAALQLTVLFSALYLAACSNSVSGNSDESGPSGSSSSATIESSSEQSDGVVPPCKTESEDNCEYGSVVDERDGQVYKTVKIGDQWWTAENLNYGSSYKNCCVSDDCIRPGRAYGSKEVQNVCPAGWHLPSKAEFRTLIAMVGGDSVAGRVLGSSNLYDCENCPAGTDDYGFSAVRVYGEYWGAPRLERSFWSSTDVSDTAFENDSDADMYKNARYAFRLEDTLARVSLVSEWETRMKLHARCVKNTTAAPKISHGIELPCNSLTTGTILDRCRNSKEDHCEYGTLTDERDGQVYKTVKIGDQWWMAENLNFRYLQKTESLDSSSFCRNDSLAYCEKYGREYLWSAAMDSAALYSTNAKGCGLGTPCAPETPVRGVCPAGWHIPSKDEWSTLFWETEPNIYYEYYNWDASGEHSYNGYMLMSEESWGDYGPRGTNRFGFNAFSGVFWSSTIGKYTPESMWYVYVCTLGGDEEYIGVDDQLGDRRNLYPVRCIKD